MCGGVIYPYPQIACNVPIPVGQHKQKVMRHPFQPEEDARLIQLMTASPFRSWDSVALQFENRTPRQCRERWLNYLCPHVRTGAWTHQEDELLVAMVSQYGRSWSCLSHHFNGRSENDIKNRWYSHLQHETELVGTRLVLVPNRFHRPKRRRVIVDVKEKALRLVSDHSTDAGPEKKALPVLVDFDDPFDAREWDDDRDASDRWFGVGVDGF
jgi:hypothetical protein